MATVTGYTAERMKQIEDSTIVDGDVIGGNLILATRNGTSINAGSVIGPTGVAGPVGPTSIVVCTSITRPTGGSRFEGLAIYETDTDRMYVWNGTVWVNIETRTLCTSTTRPGVPYPGQEIYETDTAKTLVYQSATTGWTPPWNTPWGVMGAKEVVADQSGITVVTDLALLSVTFTAVANRRLRATAEGIFTSSVVGDIIVGYITDNVNIVKGRWAQCTQLAAAGQGQKQRGAINVPSTVAGSTTLKARAERNFGSGSVTFQAAAGYPASFLVEDLGPNGLPL